MLNGTLWKDSDGNPIHAHGGHVLKFKEWYYWYGEDRRGQTFVSCYKTKDFKEFFFCNDVLTAKSKTSDTGKGWDVQLTKTPSVHTDGILSRYNEKGELLCNIERPKVVINKNGKFVMWMHYENGADYSDARCAVAVCDVPDGDFTYLGSFNPLNNTSRDCTLYEENGRVYFISAARDNKDLNVYRLNGDCTDIEKQVATLFRGKEREAPAFFRRNGKTYVISSGCTGWTPNQGKWAVANGIEEKFSLLYDFGDATTFDTQPSFVVSGENGYVYFADRWGGSGEKYFLSSYVALNIAFEKDKPYITYCDTADIRV